MSIIVEINEFIDTAINGGALAVFQTLSAPSAKFLTLLGGAALAGWSALHALRGSFSFDGFLMFVLRFGLFYGLVSGSFLWLNHVYPFLSDFGQGVGTVIISEFGGESDSEGLVQALSGFISTSLRGVQAALRTYGVTSLLDSSAWMAFIFGLVSFVTIIAMAVTALALIIFSKVLMAILIGITPVLAVWAFIKGTADVFNGWLRGVTMLILFQILLYGILGTVIAASDSLSIQASDAVRAKENVSAAMLTFTMLSGIGLVNLFLCPMVAYTVGGAAMNLGGNAVQNTLRSMGNGLAERLGGGQQSDAALRGASDARSEAARQADVKDENGQTARDRAKHAKILERLNRPD
ncbi:type IV secretion system protein [Pelagibius sp. Alg239-R121]|uniref:type IV secretion system protein n=1 Tax=Pelagibius sp. Alg239-R121 TaxID=2993448 RepID=UPI0024A73585|nr:type IV secretion system protein [Pelagibius sp. Alg239-R121]